MMKKMSVILSILALSVFTVNAATVSGLVDSGGVGLAGVIVTLTPVGGGTAMMDTTLATGDYSIAAVAAGFYNVTADKAGFTPYAGFINVGGNPAYTRNITLTLAPPGITLSGHVFDSASGNPLPGTIIRLSTVGGGATVIDSAVTAANGSYSLLHVQAANYNLSATAAGHVAQTVRVAVTAAGGNLVRDFTLAGLPAGIKITGHVLDSASGNPISGAVVRLRTGGFPVTIIDSAITIANGTYSLDSVQAGTYSMVAAAAGHTSVTVTGVVVANAPVTRDFTLVGLPAGITISGSVYDSVSGAPLAGAIVRLRTGGPGGGTLVDSAITIANGSYHIDSVQAGTYNLVASAIGHVSKTDAGIVVAAVALSRDFDLVRTPGIAITGRVADSASGLPLSGAIVRAFQGGVLVDSAIAAANGTYSLSVPAGTYTLTANAAGHGTKSITGLVVNGPLTGENFFLVPGVGVVTVAGNKSAAPEFVMTAGHILQLRNFNDAGVVSVYGLSGKLVYRTSFEAHAASVALPGSIARGGLYLVSISQRNAVYRKQIVLQ